MYDRFVPKSFPYVLVLSRRFQGFLVNTYNRERDEFHFKMQYKSDAFAYTLSHDLRDNQ